MENKRVWITTVDNPFDYFTQFDQWFQFDVEFGYHTCSYVARIARTSDALTDDEYNQELERAIDEIISLFPGMYKKIYSNT